MGSTGTSYESIQSLTRGLAILEALNSAGPHGAHAPEIAQATGLNRSTVKRMLETLTNAGYVRHASDGAYHLASGVLALSRGFGEAERLLECAAPVLRDLLDEMAWSLSVTLPDGGAMVIRETTHPFSAVSFEPAVSLRRSIPMLLTAAGRVYFAGCSDEERNRIVRVLRASGAQPDTSMAGDERLTERLALRVRTDGFAFNDGDWPGMSRSGAIAVPIHRVNGQPLGALSLVYMRPAWTREQVLQRCLPRLQEGVARIEARLRA